MASQPLAVPAAVWTARRAPATPMPGASARPWCAIAHRRSVEQFVGFARWIAAAGGWATGWLLLLVLVPTLVLGWVPVIVMSGSMSPDIVPGDVVLADPAAPLQVGDVVTVERDGRLVTHRVVAIEARGVRTRGDANAVDDSGWTPPTAVVGRGRLLVPLVGLPLAWADGLVVSSGAQLTGATTTSGSSLQTGTVDPATGLATEFSCGLLGLGAGIRVTWTAPTSPLVTGLRLDRSTDGGSTWIERVALDASATHHDDAVSLSTTYTYRVVSLTGTVWISTSATVSETTPALCL